MFAISPLRNSKTLVLLALTVFVLLPDFAFAAGGTGGGGTGGDVGAFNDLYLFVKGLLGGSLGKLLTILSLGVALVIAVKVNSVIGALSAFAVALCAIYGPVVLESLFTATLPVAASAGVISGVSTTAAIADPMLCGLLNSAALLAAKCLPMLSAVVPTIA